MAGFGTFSGGGIQTGRWRKFSGNPNTPVFTAIANTSGVINETYPTITPSISNPAGFSLTYSIVGTLPIGLSINSANGVISGTPTQNGTFPNLRIKAVFNGGQAVSNAFTIAVYSVSISVSDQVAYQGEAYSFSPVVSNPGGLTVSYSFSGSADFTINSSSGLVSGTPSSGGVSTGQTISVSFGLAQTVVSNSFKITAKAQPSIANISNQVYVQNDPSSVNLSITDADAVITSVSIGAGTLPTGLTLSNTSISGTPTVVGTQSGLKVRLSYGTSSHIDSNAFSIQTKTPPSIAAITDKTGTVGTAFSFSPTITNTDAVSITYSSVGTALPSGLSISSSTGAITGTPATAQTSTAAQIRLAYGNSSHTDSNTFAISVAGPNDGYAQSALGFNLAEMVDYGTQFAFKNMIKQGRTWTPSSGTLSLDAQGFPTSLAAGQSARMYWITSIPSSGTTYTETHSGQGTFTEAAQTATQMYWDLTATTPGNNLRGLQMMIPGTTDDGTHPFYQPFLDMLAGFGILRFMDWDSTNLNKIVNWADRTTTDQYTFTGGTSPTLNVHGQQNTVPYEHMITLCNQTQCDMWVCVPSAASDDYITQLATLIFNNLNPGLRCFYELSNEVWNQQFYGNQYFSGQAAALGLGGTFTNILQAYSIRCVQMFNLVDAVYGASASVRRRRVMGAQSGNNGTADTPLGYLNAYQKVDYLAIAPYLTVNLAAGATVSDIQTHAYSATDGYAKQVVDVNNSKSIATGKYGVPLAFYEFGPGFPNVSGDPNTAAYLQYNISSNMEQLVKDYINAVWVGAAGSCPACWYNVCAPAAQFDWGACRTVLDTNTAKMRALRTFVNVPQTPPPAIQQPIISAISDGYATQNVAYSFTPTVSNPSSLTQSFSISGNTLPTGLSISSTTGTISGTPTVVGAATGFQIVDGYSGAATGTVISNAFSITVQSAGSGPVAGYTAWYDPSDAGNTTIVSSAFSQINDKSTNAYHLTQATAGNRPPTTTINSRTATNHPWNGLFMTGTTGSNMLAASAYTAFMVVKPSTPSSNATDYNNNAAWGFEGATGTGLYLSSGSPSLIALNDDGGTLDQATATFTANTAYVVCTKHNGTNISISINGGAFTDVASGATASLANTFNWGRGFGASPWFQGAIGEAIFYNTELSGANISTNVTYLRNRWGI